MTFPDLRVRWTRLERRKILDSQLTFVIQPCCHPDNACRTFILLSFFFLTVSPVTRAFLYYHSENINVFSIKSFMIIILKREKKNE